MSNQTKLNKLLFVKIYKFKTNGIELRLTELLDEKRFILFI